LRLKASGETNAKTERQKRHSNVLLANECLIRSCRRAAFELILYVKDIFHQMCLGLGSLFKKGVLLLSVSMAE
jgi:hypothetical protein